MQNRTENLTRDGVTLTIEVKEGRIFSTVTLFRGGTPQPLRRGPVALADAFSQALDVSEAEGFHGFYEVNEPDEWPSLPFTG